MKKLLLFGLIFVTSGVYAHDSNPTQSAQEMQISAIERWSRMVTNDQRKKSARKVQQDAELSRQQTQNNPDGTPVGYQSNGYTGEGE